MTHIRLKYVQAFVDRKTGVVFRYFRRPGFPRVRPPGLPGSPEFNRAYEDALAGAPVEIGARRTKPGTVNAALAGYYQSLEWRSLSAGTQAHRRSILERFRAAHGDKPIALLPQKFIVLTSGAISPNSFACGVQRPGSPTNARRTACARRPAVGSPKLDARPTRSPPSVGTRR